MSLTRRTFLKLSGGILAAAPFVRANPAEAAPTPPPVVEPAKRPFGRAIYGNLIVRETPAAKGKKVRALKMNEVVALQGQAEGTGPTEYNKVWYQLEDGWVHSGNIQPTENDTANTVVENIDNSTRLSIEKYWAEFTVPYEPMRTAPDLKSAKRLDGFYSMIMNISGLVEGADKEPWYQINDFERGKSFYAPAKHMRMLTADDLAPLSPDVPVENKRLHVDLKAQRVTAFENDTQVWTAKCATGLPGHPTAKGKWMVYLKVRGQRMFGGGAGGAGGYDLAGIPWISYFVRTGISFHGTYWHNDYGKPRSHGCVNLLPEDAKWVYKWSMPLPKEANRFTHTTKIGGTLVEVV